MSGIFQVLCLSIFVSLAALAQEGAPTQSATAESATAGSSTPEAATPPPIQKPLTFADAIAALQGGDAATALAGFESALKENGKDANALTNAGIAAAQLEKWGLAVAYLRDALTLSPFLPEAKRALTFVEKRLQTKEIPHTFEFWEVLHQEFLKDLSLASLLFLGAPLLLLAGLLLLRWLKERETAFSEDLPLPRLQGLHLFVIFLSVFCLVATLAKWIDLSQVRGTILPEKIAVHSAADPKAPALFELYGGLEVLVLREENGWTQVRYPGGPSGWIQNDSIRTSAVGG